MMQAYLIIRDGQIVLNEAGLPDVRWLGDDEPLPSHKLDVDGGPLLRPFVDTPAPDFSPLEAVSSELVVSQAQVERVWTVTRKAIEEQIAAVREECGLRIYERFPQWKQANYTARASELIEKKADGETLSEAEAGELAALRGVWAWIKSVREASNALEAEAPIPLTYRADAHWPAAYEGPL